MISPLDFGDKDPLLGLGVKSRELRTRSVARAMSNQSSSASTANTNPRTKPPSRTDSNSTTDRKIGAQTVFPPQSFSSSSHSFGDDSFSSAQQNDAVFQKERRFSSSSSSAARARTTTPAADHRRARWKARNTILKDCHEDFYDGHDINPAASSPSVSQRDLKNRPDSFRVECP